MWSDEPSREALVARLALWISNIAGGEVEGMSMCASLALKNRLSVPEFSALLDAVTAITGWQVWCGRAAGSVERRRV